MRWTETSHRRCLLFLLWMSAVSAFALAQQPALPPQTSANVQPQFLIVLDAAHGGTDIGAHLGAHFDEKDLVLTLSIRLRSMLTARGVSVITTRETDLTLSPAQRAALANAHKPSACLILHATDSGSGIHLFTSSLPPAKVTEFLPWDQAQAAYLQQSMRWAGEINSAMTHAGLPLTLGRTAMQPLDNLTCPAAAVEIAPLTKDGTITAQLTDPDYQSRVLAGLAAAVESWRRDWRTQP
jgi:N-acetylmuramoyl-L-alanine amidase